jgi:ribonuclease E
MKKEMLINVLQPEECRIAIIEDGSLEELYVERTSHESYVGNIYKGRIVNIEPSIQAAFVDFGVGRNGFLHVSDVEPQYYRHLEEGGEGAGRRRRPPLELPDMPVYDPPEDDEEDDFAPADDAAAGADEPESADDETVERAPSVERRTRPPEQPEETAPPRQTPERSGPRPFGGMAATPSAEPKHGQRRDHVPAAAKSPRRPSEPELDAGLEFDDADRGFEGDRGFIEDDEQSIEDREDRAEQEEEEDDGPRRRERGGRRFRGRRRGGRPGPIKQKPPIQEIFRRGQEVLIQVIKEGIGTKGPTLSTYISIPGRYLVLMPGLSRIGVSRKINDEEQRRRLRAILQELEPPQGLGFIIRTAGLDRSKKELQRDLAYLSRVWKVVVRRIKNMKSPASIYQESDLITRTIRDVFTSEIESIWVDEPQAYEHAKEFLQIVMPRYASRIKLYEEREPLFHRHRLEHEIAQIHNRHVPLPQGGSLVIDQTEALVAIDVNSGNFRADNNAEETAYQMNLKAAREIARQLRLRDLGGVIINDFIDMREDRHRREVERVFREAVRRDRARTKLLRISPFGIIEMTRQRIRPSLKRSVYEDCPACRSTGQVKTCESMSIEVMRLIQLAAHRENVTRVTVHVNEAVAYYLQNKKRREIAQLEEHGKIQVTIHSVVGAYPEHLGIVCSDSNGSEVKLLAEAELPATRGRRS